MSEITEAEWADMKKDLDDYCRTNDLPIQDTVEIDVDAPLFENSEKDATLCLRPGRKRGGSSLKWMREHLSSSQEVGELLSGSRK